MNKKNINHAWHLKENTRKGAPSNGRKALEFFNTIKTIFRKSSVTQTDYFSLPQLDFQMGLDQPLKAYIMGPTETLIQIHVQMIR